MEYIIAQTVIVGIATISCFAIWICSKTVSKIHKDPARQWIQGLRGALGALWVSGLMFCVVMGLFLARSFSNLWYQSRSTERVYYVLDAFYGLLFTIAQALIFCMFSDLVAGLSFIKNGVIDKKVRGAQIATSIVAGIVILLSIVSLALRLAVNLSDDSDTVYNLLPHVRRIGAGIAVIFMIWCVVAVGVAIGSIVRYKDIPNARSASSFFLGAAITNMIPHVFTIAYLAEYVGFDGSLRRYSIYGPPIWLPLLGTILDFIPMLVVLIVMFSLAAKKNPGMWTVAQPVTGPQFVYQQPQWYGQPQQPYAQPQQYGQYNGQYNGQYDGQYNSNYQQNMGWQQQQQQPMASPQYDQRASQQWSQPVAQNHVVETK